MISPEEAKGWVDVAKSIGIATLVAGYFMWKDWKQSERQLAKDEKTAAALARLAGLEQEEAPNGG